MKKVALILALSLAVTMFITGCQYESDVSDSSQGLTQSDSSQKNMSMASFSYEEDKMRYQDTEAKVYFDGFLNTEEQPINNQIEAEERAKVEVTIEYNGISDYRDSESGMWRVDFYTKETRDNGVPVLSNIQKVYLDDDGITHMIVYEE